MTNETGTRTIWFRKKATVIAVRTTAPARKSAGSLIALRGSGTPASRAGGRISRR